MALGTSCPLVVLILLLTTNSVYSQAFSWCTISSEEQTKCNEFADELVSAGIIEAGDMTCVEALNTAECFGKIETGEADLITLDGGDIFHAGESFRMKVIMGEEYNYGRNYYAVAVIKKENAGWRFEDLLDKKSCHTGVRKTSGWNVPIGYMIEAGFITVNECEGDIKAAGRFFSQSCAPGALLPSYNPHSDNPGSLCDLCIGTQSNKCARSSVEPYYNYDGALRCLHDGAGDVAFVKHTTLDDVASLSWANDLDPADYLFMCKDGTTKGKDDFESCNLARVAGHAVMTSGNTDDATVERYQNILTEAATRFGDDDGTGFKLFDSGSNKDLLFKDSTVDLYTVTGDNQEYRNYLGEDYVDTVKALSLCDSNLIRWCTISAPESAKCRDMKAAFDGASLSKSISCYQARDHQQCMQLIKDGRADVITLDGGDAYQAGKEFDLVPVAGEKYSNELAAASYYAVAVVKKSSSFSINDLAGKKSCHTGIMKTSGWIVPVGWLINNKKINVGGNCDVPAAVGGYFSQSCAPGAKSSKYDPNDSNPGNLCELCIGEDANNCVRNDHEPYYDYSGAFRCLAEDAGDVAFVKHTTVSDNTDNQNTDAWAVNLNSEDYELLCPDGSRKAISEWKTCNLAKVPSHVVMTSKDNDRNAIWQFLDEAQGRFGQGTSENFKMYDSSNYEGSDLLFKDKTLALVSAVDSDSYRHWLGEDYVSDLEALTCATTGSGNTLIFSPILLFCLVLMALLAN